MAPVVEKAASRPALPEGQRIGNFELQAVASCSASAIVYRAWDLSLTRAVAIKEYWPASIATRDPRGEIRALKGEDAQWLAGARRAFVAQCQTLARCDHPSLARVLHLLEAHGTAYCVMPWYSGRPLLEVRPKIGQRVPEVLLRSLLDDYLGALESYHRVGGVHGCVRPSKLLLLDDDRGLLLGPGATHPGPSLRPIGAAGAPDDRAFAAVEQLSAVAGTPGPWTDFYALAAIVRYWLTGALPPGPGQGPPEPLAETLSRHPPGRSPAPYSESLLLALDAALSVDIGRRPQTAAQFRRWLVTTQRPSAVPPGPPPASAAPPARAAAPPDSPGERPELRAANLRQVLARVRDADGQDDEVDTAAADAIRRVIDSIPGTPRRIEPRPAGEPWPPATFEPLRVTAEEPAPLTGSPPSSGRPAPRRAWAWLGAAAIAMVLLAVAAWQAVPYFDPGTDMERTSSRSPPSAPPSVPGVPPTPPDPRPGETAGSLSTGDPPVEPTSPTVVEPGTPEPAEANLTPAAPAATQPQPVTPQAAARPIDRDRAAPSPRALCGTRTEFALYRCMQQQCSLSAWKRHPQCVRFKATDRVE